MPSVPTPVFSWGNASSSSTYPPCSSTPSTSGTSWTLAPANNARITTLHENAQEIIFVGSNNANSTLVLMMARITQTRQIDCMALINDLPAMGSPATPLRLSTQGPTDAAELDTLPPTPATPAYLEHRNREVFSSDVVEPSTMPRSPPRFVVEMMGNEATSESNAPIRKRIRRMDDNAPTKDSSKQRGE
ncbi:hypothetical protein QAD02_003185 [Eretmocerus hayati]|uniref:Uncharacterized protein n=1 Tax=Eretmocerus hayati TaxID=131215 RepID=A0ACC2NLZ4_9HYME|nr:hypothetical protein QAD02_003185 [Eretmocerus hayati]